MERSDQDTISHSGQGGQSEVQRPGIPWQPAWCRSLKGSGAENIKTHRLGFKGQTGREYRFIEGITWECQMIVMRNHSLTRTLAPTERFLKTGRQDLCHTEDHKTML